MSSRKEVLKIVRERIAKHKAGGSEWLDLALIDFGDDEIFTAAIKEVPRRLTHVELSECQQVSDAGVRVLAERCPRLAHVSLRGCQQVSDAGVINLAEKCKDLTHVNLSWCKQVSDAGVIKLAEKCTDRLKRVYLSRCQQVSDLGVIELAEKCPQLKHVDLSWCQQVSDLGVIKLAEKCPHLTHVDLSWCEQVGDAAVIKLAKKCMDLTHVDLYGCQQVSDAGVIKLAENCADHLTRVYISVCQVSDAGVTALAQHCPRLARVYLSECEQVTDAGVTMLAQHCPGLTHVYLSGCGQVTDEGVKAFAERHDSILEQLGIHGTRVTAPESLIGSGDARAILSHYRELLTAQEAKTARRIPEVKVLLVGQGETGKTTLRHRALCDKERNPWYVEKDANRTHNIATSKFEKDGITYRVWDFGGQDHLHGTHRFFLGTDHALYILVLDATKTPRENRFSYWLRFLAHHGYKNQQDRAPILIVLNKCDEVMLAATDSLIARNHRLLQDEWKLAKNNNWFGANVVADPIAGQGWHHRHRVEFSETALKPLRDMHEQALNAFEQAFAAATTNVVNLNSEYAPGYLAVKDYISEVFSNGGPDREGRFEGTPWLDYREPPLREVFEQNGTFDEEGQIRHLRFACDLGLAHFVGHLSEVADDDNTDMQVKLFNPTWVKRPVYSLIRYAEDERGFVPVKKFRYALEQPMGGALDLQGQNVIRRLMTVCRLAFEMVCGGKPGVLIPDRLEYRNEEKLEQWPFEETTRLTLTAPFLPDRVFLRYLAEHYRQIHDPQKECYRNEAVIPYAGEIEVLVQSFLSPVGLEEPRLEIAARGGTALTRDYVVRQVRDEFQKIMVKEGIDLARGGEMLAEYSDEVRTGGAINSSTRAKKQRGGSNKYTEAEAKKAKHARTLYVKNGFKNIDAFCEKYEFTRDDVVRWFDWCRKNGLSLESKRCD